MAGSEFTHLACTDQQNGFLLECLKDLPGQLNGTELTDTALSPILVSVLTLLAT